MNPPIANCHLRGDTFTSRLWVTHRFENFRTDHSQSSYYWYPATNQIKFYKHLGSMWFRSEILKKIQLDRENVPYSLNIFSHLLCKVHSRSNSMWIDKTTLVSSRSFAWIENGRSVLSTLTQQVEMSKKTSNSIAYSGNPWFAIK